MTAFRPLRPVVAVAACYLLAALAWALGGGTLPGGRWLAVHLFTIGVLTNLVAGLSHHFAQTLAHAPGRGGNAARLVVLNLGALLLLVGRASGRLPALAAGATVLLAAVLWLYVDLRRLRRRALQGRFAFVLRGYERACGAFTHGALLGLLLGLGLLPGAWYSSGRLAHLHVNLLGWGGLTLLATAVFFGPTILRVRMEEGADAAASGALRRAATALSGAALALLLTGAGGPWAPAARLVAAGGLGVYAWSATAVCLPVLRAGRRAAPSAHGRLLRGACGWFLAAVWADAVLVAAGRLGLVEALGAALLVGVLGQAILASLAYLSPLLGAGDAAWRAAAAARLAALARARPAALNLGVALITAAALAGRAAGDAGALLARGGWALVAAAVLAQAALTVRALTTAPARGAPG